MPSTLRSMHMTRFSTATASPPTNPARPPRASRPDTRARITAVSSLDRELGPAGFRSGSSRGRPVEMNEHQRLLALLEVYDTAIEELYVLGDSGFMDLILRLERRRQDTAARLSDGAASGGAFPENVPIAASPKPL